MIAAKHTQGCQVFFLGPKIDPEEQAEYPGIPAEHVMASPANLKAACEIFARAAKQTAREASAPRSHAASSGAQADTPPPRHQPSPQIPRKISDDIAVCALSLTLGAGFALLNCESRIRSE